MESPVVVSPAQDFQGCRATVEVLVLVCRNAWRGEKEERRANCGLNMEKLHRVGSL